MKFQQLYSSSKANLYVVTANSGEKLLIECGCTWKQLEKNLYYKLDNIVGCLITHEHKDHCKCANDVRKAGIKVLASEETLKVLEFLKPFTAANDREDWHLIRKAGMLHPDLTSCTYPLGGFQILSFPTIHDAAEPIGFVIYCDGEYLLFATDTKYIRQRFPYPFSIIALECSYDKDILQEMVDTKKIEESVAKRLLDSHQEKSVCLNYIQKFCNLSKCREINLLHMSNANISKKQTAKDFEKELFITTIAI